MLFDTLWGAMIVLGIGFEPLPDLALDIGFLAGWPAYALDARSRRRIIVFLPAVYLWRWFAFSRIGPAPHDWSPPWRGNLLLFAASLLLQWAKARGAPGSTSRRTSSVQAPRSKA